MAGLTPRHPAYCPRTTNPAPAGAGARWVVTSARRAQADALDADVRILADRGYSQRQTAKTLGVSPRSVAARWPRRGGRR